MNTKINKLPGSMVEIEAELDAASFEAYFKNALKKLGETAKVDGFREGKVPENILLKNIPEIKILEEMATMAINEHYPKILEEEKIDAISRPEISITKLARNNPLEFKIKTAVLPEIQLGDYKKTAHDVLLAVTDEEKNIVVTDEDMENTIMDIRKSRAPKIHMAAPTSVENQNVEKNPEGDKAIDPELPPFDDEFVQALGPFKDVADFKEKLKINLKLEKENRQKEKTRLSIIEKIIEGSTLDVPEILIDLELDKIIYRMQSDITTMGLKFEDYLKHLNKTVEDLRKEFKPDAEKKAKLSLILNEIAKVEKIVADPEQLEQEVSIILEQYKDADPERARMHAENVLTNEKIFQFLESQ